MGNQKHLNMPAYQGRRIQVRKYLEAREAGLIPGPREFPLISSRQRVGFEAGRKRLHKSGYRDEE